MGVTCEVKKLTISNIVPPCCMCGNHSDYYVKMGSREVYFCKRSLAALMNEIVNCCLIDDMEEEKKR